MTSVSGHELLTALNAFVFEGTRHPRRRQRRAEKTAQCPEECSSVHTQFFPRRFFKASLHSRA